jgi:hypothetical protein
MSIATTTPAQSPPTPAAPAGRPAAGNVALVIESSELTLARAQGPKLSNHAKAGIPVYWIINLVDNQVEVSSQPGPDGYPSHVVFKPGQDVPVVIDGVEVGRSAVPDILS